MSESFPNVFCSKGQCMRYACKCVLGELDKYKALAGKLLVVLTGTSVKDCPCTTNESCFVHGLLKEARELLEGKEKA